MVPATVQYLTTQFYEWEKRGRGWYLFEEPVDIEPPFEPYYLYQETPAYVDDGVVPGLLETIGKWVFPPKEVALPSRPLIALAAPASGYSCELVVSFRQGEKIEYENAKQLLLMFSSCESPLSFEIIATATAIQVQFVCRQEEVAYVKGQIKAYFPECIIEERNGSLHSLVSSNKPLSIIDFGLREEFMRPLSTEEGFTIDPLVGLFGVIDHLNPGEQAILQILFKGAVDPWAESILISVTDYDGKSFFLDAPEMPKLAQTKVASPLFGVVVRIIAQSSTKEQARGIIERMSATLIQTTRSTTNSLIVLSNNDYPESVHANDVVNRESHRIGMLLNGDELVNLVHFPSSSVNSAKLKRDSQKTKAAPTSSTANHIVLGTNLHQGNEQLISQSIEQRLRHTHVIGATGTGKSTLLLNLIQQDIRKGRGIAVLDPHGDLVETILSNIPANRISDVVVIDPSDALFPVAFNILRAHSEIEKDVLSSDLVAVFRRLSTSWGDAMNSVFANGILAFLESEKGGTLMDLRRFFVEKPFRDSFLQTVSDPSIVYYWNKEYPLLKSNSIGPILTRLDSFLRPKLIRNMVAQKRGLDFERMMDSQKILLVKLPQGLIGTENSYLLGTIFVSKIYQAAMARQAQGNEQRNDFFLYIDEFQHFITPSMSHILSGARKYHLGLILAHQDMQQLVKEDTELANAVISNAGTRICFRLGDTDAKRFEDGFSSFDASDLQNLEIGKAIARIGRPDYDFNLAIPAFTPQEKSLDLKQEVITQSREKYGTPREVIEKELEYLRQEEKPKEEIPKEAVEVRILEIPKEEIKKIELPVKELINTEETTERFIKQKEISQHRYLQTLIKRMAESRGYKAMIEEPTPDGKGRVDVALERNGRRIACEIGVTTTKDWEVHNIEKCLSAGFETVVAISNDPKALDVMRKKVIEHIDAKILAKVLVMDSESLFLMLDKEIAKDATAEKRMKGYRIKVEYDAVSNDAMKHKKESVTKIVLDSIKKRAKK